MIRRSHGQIRAVLAYCTDNQPSCPARHLLPWLRTILRPAPTQRQRKIIHVDCDCFYASIEMRDDPRLGGKPLAVGGTPDRRGVVATCNYEARAFGVRSAMSSIRRRNSVPTWCSSSRASRSTRRCRGRSRDLPGLHRADRALSLDEAYLDVTQCELFNGSATLIARDIRRRVWQELNITVSAGSRPTSFSPRSPATGKSPTGVRHRSPRGG